MDDQVTDTAVEKEEFSAAAPPHPQSAGVGETNFADAEAPPAGGARTGAADGADGAPDEPVDTQPASPGGTEAAKYLELAKRTQADFENYRKRMARENAAAAERGAVRLAKELLPAIDHLELALKAAAEHTQPDAGEGGGEDLVKGFAMVAEELAAALAKVGIQGYSPQGEPFDPNEHEAMAQQPSEDAESGTVLEVYQRGYRVNGAVLRPARVVVAQ
jgi:molecular chaperone GrpE